MHSVAPFALSALPYERNALEPYLSARTLGIHYGNHHQRYVDKLNELVSGTDVEGMTLEELILKTAGHAREAGIFNNAAQVWNHDFYWNSLSPDGGGRPAGELGRKIEADFGGPEKFLEEFAKAGSSHFGSGWVWLVEDEGRLKIIRTSDAENPLSLGQATALLAIDVWEHAYYLEYQNRRGEYLKALLDKLIHWRFAETNLAAIVPRWKVG